MTWLSGRKMLLVVSLCHFVSPHEDGAVLLLKYPKDTITETVGTRIKLSCNAEYNFKQCGYVEVAWHRCAVSARAPQNCTELTDPNRYVTIVNETIVNERTSLRRRQVVTEIIQLTPADEGVFQCHAKCEISSETAMGHYITVKAKHEADLANG